MPTVNRLRLGSGFFVRKGLVATNLHVVEDAAKGYAKRVGQETKYVIEGITARDDGNDLVIIKVSALDVPALTLGDSDAVQVGEAVYAVGNPRGLDGTFSQGVISSIREVKTRKRLQFTAPISPGSSGGPVLNEVGEVIGISVAIFRKWAESQFRCSFKLSQSSRRAKSEESKPVIAGLTLDIMPRPTSGGD